MKKLSRKHEDVLKRAAQAAALYEQGIYTMRAIAEKLGYRTEGGARYLLGVQSV